MFRLCSRQKMILCGFVRLKVNPDGRLSTGIIPIVAVEAAAIKHLLQRAVGRFDFGLLRKTAFHT